MDIGEEDFYTLAKEALTTLPEELLDDLENVAIVAEGEPEGGSETLGTYEGTTLTERDSLWFGMPSDRVVPFHGLLSRMCGDEDNLLEKVSIALIHEVGHYHGIDEERLHELGWS